MSDVEESRYHSAMNSREPLTCTESSYHFSAMLRLEALAAMDFAETFPTD